MSTAARAPFALFLYHDVVEQLLSEIKGRISRHQLCQSTESCYHVLSFEKSKSIEGLVEYYDHQLAAIFLFLFLVDVFEAGLSCHCIISKAFFSSLF